MKEIISSTKNEYIKMLKTLKTKKGRKTQGLFLVEGEKCVQELLEYMPDLLSAIIVVEDTNELFTKKAVDIGRSVCTVKEHVMDALGDLKTSQGIAAIAKIPVSKPVIGGFILALDGVSDPQNVGTMIRTADAAGCNGVVLSESSADFLSPKAIRASMGSIFHIPVYYAVLPDYLSGLKENGYRIACADMNGDSNYKYDWKKTCLVIGNESRGISQEVMSLSTDRISVAMYGKAESLNAAAASAILIYKIREYHN